MPRNEHFPPRNNGNCFESIPRKFFGTKFRSQSYSQVPNKFKNKNEPTNFRPNFFRIHKIISLWFSSVIHNKSCRKNAMYFYSYFVDNILQVIFFSLRPSRNNYRHKSLETNSTILICKRLCFLSATGTLPITRQTSYLPPPLDMFSQ